MSEAIQAVQKVVPVYHVELVRDREVKVNGRASTIEQSAEVFHQLMDRSPIETMWVLYLDSDSNIVGSEQVGLGGVEMVDSQFSTIFRGAIVSLAAQIVVAHFHLVGDAKPSDQDILFTDELMHVAHHLDIRVRDHLVIAPGKHFSIRENWDTLLNDFDRRQMEKLSDSGLLCRLKAEVGKMLQGGQHMIDLPGMASLDIPKKGGDPKANIPSDPENTLSYLWEQARR